MVFFTWMWSFTSPPFLYSGLESRIVKIVEVPCCPITGLGTSVGGGGDVGEATTGPARPRAPLPGARPRARACPSGPASSVGTGVFVGTGVAVPVAVGVGVRLGGGVFVGVLVAM